MNSDVPFGFGTGDDDMSKKQPGNGGDGNSPAFGFNADGMDMANLGAALQQLGQLLQSSGGPDAGPVNWEMALDVARKAIAEKGDPTPSAAEKRAVEDACGLAEVWLDPATVFPATGGDAHTWSRSDWLAATAPEWRKMVTPIAEQVQSTMATMMPGPDDLASGGLPEGLPPELAAMAAPLMNMAKTMSAAMFSMQTGQGLAALAGDVICSSDIGIPLTSDGHSAIVAGNVTQFAEGLDIPRSDVLVYVALREAAHQRLFAHVPWLRSRVEAAVAAYARGVKVDQSRIESALSGIDVQNPEEIQNALASGVFEPEDTPEQKAALARLETLLALVEGWVDDVVDMAAADRLPSYDRLRETLRRRRATGGPAERTFATLVGLELRPRRLRDAASLWQQLRSDGDIDARDGLWEHPDLLPTAEDLDDVAGFLSREQRDVLAELEEQLGNEDDTGDSGPQRS